MKIIEVDKLNAWILANQRDEGGPPTPPPTPPPVPPPVPPPAPLPTGDMNAQWQAATPLNIKNSSDWYGYDAMGVDAGQDYWVSMDPTAFMPFSKLKYMIWGGTQGNDMDAVVYVLDGNNQRILGPISLGNGDNGQISGATPFMPGWKRLLWKIHSLMSGSMRILWKVE